MINLDEEDGRGRVVPVPNEETHKCAMCGSTEDLSYEPSRKQLLMGNLYFVPTYECRCEKCEQRLADDLVRVIRESRTA